MSLIRNVMVEANGTRVVLGRKAAARSLKDAELLLKDAGKLLRRKSLSQDDFNSLEARLGGVLDKLEWGLGALGVALEPTG